MPQRKLDCRGLSVYWSSFGCESGGRWLDHRVPLTKRKLLQTCCGGFCYGCVDGHSVSVRALFSSHPWQHGASLDVVHRVILTGARWPICGFGRTFSDAWRCWSSSCLLAVFMPSFEKCLLSVSLGYSALAVGLRASTIMESSPLLVMPFSNIFTLSVGFSSTLWSVIPPV